MSGKPGRSGRPVGTGRANYLGKRVGKLVAFERVITPTGQQNKWWCRCDCGNEILVSQGNLAKEMTKSCGCLKRNKRQFNRKLP